MAQEKVDSLKKMNEDAQAEICQLKNHQTTLNDKVRFLEKDAFDRDGFKKAFEEFFLQLEIDLSKSNMTFKKYEASASTVEKVCLNQKHSWDTRGIGYEVELTKSKQHQYNKCIKFVPEDWYNSFYFVPIFYYYGIRGHIRPQCHKLYGLPVNYVQTRNLQNQGRSYNGQMSNRFHVLSEQRNFTRQNF